MAKKLGVEGLGEGVLALGFAVVAPKKRQAQAAWGWERRTVSRTVLCGLMLFALGLVSLFTGQIAADLEWSTHLPRRWRSKKAGYGKPADIWKSEFSDLYYGCSQRGSHYIPAVRENKSNGYLLIATSGGLNQQRTGIIDAVVVARILNATLVVPELDHHSYWKDNSDFADIFDVDWFISSLSKDVTVIKRIPDKVMRSMEKPPYTMRVPRKSTPEYYLDEVLPILLRRRVITVKWKSCTSVGSQRESSNKMESKSSSKTLLSNKKEKMRSTCSKTSLPPKSGPVALELQWPWHRPKRSQMALHRSLRQVTATNQM